MITETEPLPVLLFRLRETRRRRRRWFIWGGVVGYTFFFVTLASTDDTDTGVMVSLVAFLLAPSLLIAGNLLYNKRSAACVNRSRGRRLRCLPVARMGAQRPTEQRG